MEGDFHSPGGFGFEVDVSVLFFNLLFSHFRASWLERREFRGLFREQSFPLGHMFEEIWKNQEIPLLILPDRFEQHP